MLAEKVGALLLLLLLLDLQRGDLGLDLGALRGKLVGLGLIRLGLVGHQRERCVRVCVVG